MLDLIAACSRFDEESLSKIFESLTNRDRSRLIRAMVAEERIPLSNWALDICYRYLEHQAGAAVIVTHPGAGETLLVRIARTERHHQTLIPLAQHELAKKDGPLRDALLACEDAATLRWVARLDGAPFRNVYLRVLEKEVSHAVLILEEAREEQLAVLEPEDVLPLLEQEGTRRRIRAQAAVTRAMAARQRRAPRARS